MKKITIITCLIALAGGVSAQILETKKTWVSGYARGVIYNDALDLEEDSLTAKKLNSGHTLVDLAVNLQPVKNVYINGMVRVRNEQGGFWGSGVTFDVRQLSLKGVVGDVVRYQLGDVNYKLTPYTFFNSDEELTRYEPKVFTMHRDMVHQDMFYDENNTWRQQGATAEFGLSFKKYIKEMNFNLFTMQLRPGLNGNSNRLFSGGNISFVQSKYVDFHMNHVSTFDIEGTAANNNTFKNPVTTGGVGLHYTMDGFNIDFNSEFGSSNYERITSTDTIMRDDVLADAKITIGWVPKNLKLTVGFQDVGPDFRSTGAQTKRIDFNNQPQAYNRYGNNQVVRPMGMYDMIRDASLYNSTLSTTLMAFNPMYGNFQPFGAATPNRRNISVAIDWLQQDSIVGVSVSNVMGSEIVGSGTLNLKQFNALNFNANIRVDKIVTLKKKVDFQVSYWQEGTNRSGDAKYLNVDLKNNMLSASLVAGLWDEFELLLGYRSLTSEGFDNIGVYDLNGELINFQELNIDTQENLLGLGFRYNFTDQSALTLQYNNYTWEDKDENQTLLPYGISNWSILYVMKF